MMTSPTRVSIAPLLLAMLAAGCTVGPDYVRPQVALVPAYHTLAAQPPRAAPASPSRAPSSARPAPRG